MQIFVTVFGLKTMTFDVEPDSTIKSVKAQIRDV